MAKPKSWVTAGGGPRTGTPLIVFDRARARDPVPFLFFSVVLFSLPPFIRLPVTHILGIGRSPRDRSGTAFARERAAHYSPSVDIARRRGSVARVLEVALAAQKDLEQPHEQHKGRSAARRGQGGPRGRGQRAVATHLEQRERERGDTLVSKSSSHRLGGESESFVPRSREIDCMIVRSFISRRDGQSREFSERHSRRSKVFFGRE